jgi:hypothetical protein
MVAQNEYEVQKRRGKRLSRTLAVLRQIEGAPNGISGPEICERLHITPRQLWKITPVLEQASEPIQRVGGLWFHGNSTRFFLFVAYGDEDYNQVLPKSGGSWHTVWTFHSQSLTAIQVALAIEQVTYLYTLPHLVHFKVQPDHRTIYAS